MGKILDQIQVIKKFKSRKNEVIFGIFENQKIVVKTYKKESFFLNECNLLRKMEHTGYAPKVVEIGKDYIITQFVEGERLDKLFQDAIFFNDNNELIALANQLSVFLQMFHFVTGYDIYDLSFRNFIISEKRCYGIDYASAVVGYSNKDVAAVIAQAMQLASQDIYAIKPFLDTILSNFHMSYMDVLNDISEYLDHIMHEYNEPIDKNGLLELFLIMGGKKNDSV